LTGAASILLALAMDTNFKPKGSPEDFGWYRRANLPHLDADGFCQFVTFRLHDSMPQHVAARWRDEARDDVAFRKRAEEFLDSGYGACWLGRTDVAQVVDDTFRFYDKKKYDLHAWVVMPNHAHILFTIYEGVHLPDILRSMKSYSASAANKLLGRRGRFWQHASFDRYIRNMRHYQSVVRYIEENPVEAGLCSKAEDWAFSSARFAEGAG
jgi:REP element-mobilizing transposase RayT